MKNKILWIIFAALLSLFILSKLFNKKTVRSFTTDIIKIDTAAVDRIVFHNADPNAKFEILKNGDSWTVKNNTVEADAQISSVSSLLNNLNNIKAQRPVAKSKDKWVEYEVDEENGKRIELFNGSKSVEDLVIGRFNFNQQTRSAKSYVRRSNDESVYVIDGFISMSISQSMDAFRDKTVVNFPANSLVSFQLESESGSRILKKENYWLNQNGEVQDSTGMVNLVNNLSNVNGTGFYDSPLKNNTPIKTLTLIDTEGKSATISCYESDGSFVIHSSQNPDSYFKSDSSGIFKTLFLDDLLIQ